MAHRPVRVTAALAASLALALGPAVGTALAADPPAATSSVLSGLDDRSLHLQGVLNARDLGGYRASDGRVVRSGLVLRSGELSRATDADLAALTDREVRYVDDLRMGIERAIAPDRIPAGAQSNWDDIIGRAAPQTMATAFAAGPDLYRAFITAPGANEGFAAVLHDILATDGAVLYHCTAGKDRTGWMSAILLTILGVDRQTVTYDYLLSNYYRDAAPGDGLNGVVPAALDAAFTQVDQTYGSFADYVRDGLKLTDADVAALRAKLLA
ncbi:tyrosine-protein phosphatase [Nocardia sp. CDC159]|uniref:Tyrosine-protein phosphatase n=1 Tax=Nocardia pulmonis TaxID=2951408 RepID=A0A9X2IXY8_9NOCA|nr:MULTISPECIES: tyrosine-protein phosphatase [Nocardia]MCM6774385.1 tyrosine-protein phosphatase [Nocardia pulmonis]MCM6787549.1 tyrosine-protein phosphatase [Nocardia sp. CDC159]